MSAVMMTTAPPVNPCPTCSRFQTIADLLETYNVNNAPISLKGAFFQSLGTNGRSCSSCHLPTEGWSISAEEVQLRFLLTQGRDPIFRTNDGSNCDQNIDTSTLQGRRKAYSLLLSRGLIRIALTLPEAPSSACKASTILMGAVIRPRFRCTGVRFRRQIWVSSVP